MLFALKRRWFKKNSNKAIKYWIDDTVEQVNYRFAAVESHETDQGEGLLITLAPNQGVAMANTLYKYINKPKNLLHVMRIDKDNLWFVFACKGVLYDDFILNISQLESAKNKDVLIRIAQEVDRFLLLDKSEIIDVYCEDLSSNDNAVVLFPDSITPLEIPILCNYKQQETDFSIALVEEGTHENLSLVLLNNIQRLKLPIDSRVISFAAFVCTIIICSYTINLLMDALKDEPVQKAKPPIVIDNFPHLTKVLTKDGMGIKQRFIFIIQDLYLMRKIKGWELVKYEAKGDISSMILNKTYGNIEDINAMYPKSVYQYENIVSGIKLTRKTIIYPIFNTPVRANIKREQVWIEEAISWTWPKQAKISFTEPIKSKTSHHYIEVASTVEFSDFFIEELDVLSSIYTGRSAAFLNLSFEQDRKSKRINGSLKTLIIGVPHEKYGIKK